MNSLSEIKEQIINFWGIEDDQVRDQIIDDIRQYAQTQEAAAFTDEVRNNFEQINYSGISVIYEALSKFPDKWGNFFKAEYERAFKAAAQSENPFEILECLEEISFIDENEIQFGDDMIKILTRYLTHDKDVLRYKAVWLMGDWISKENAHRYSAVVQKITDKLNDKNWKIRYITKGVLEDMGTLPAGYQISFMDKIKAKFSSPYSIK